MGMVMQKLEEMKVEYVTAKVEEGGVIVDQLFFHDPDGYMVEICNCQNLTVLPISSCPIKLITNTNANHTSSSSSSSFYGSSTLLHFHAPELGEKTLSSNLIISKHSYGCSSALI
ncbi:unnamed protein product [Prunus brigantina]